MQLRLSVVENGAASTDVLIDAAPGQSVAAVADEIARTLGAAGAPALFLDGVRLDPRAALVDSPIRDGVQLGLGAPAADRDGPGQGLFELRVVGGPGAGAIHRLGPGTYSIGGADTDWIRLSDPDVPAGAVLLEISVSGEATVKPSGTGVTLEAAEVDGGTAWPPRHLLSLGRVLLEAAVPDFPDAALQPSEDGSGMDYSRPPRLAPPERRTQFTLPSAPRANERRPLPWVMAIVPLVGALVMATLFKNTVFLVFALLSPVSLIANHLSEKRHGRKSHARTVEEYHRRRASIEADAEAALTAEQDAHRHDCPDPALVGLLAIGPRQRLWERRRCDSDAGTIRLGTGTLRSEVLLSDPEVEDHRRSDPLPMHEVPIAVSLQRHGVLGIAGRAGDARALACWVVVQSAVLHSPRDLTICVLAEPAGAHSWNWVRWLPHARPKDGQPAMALLGATTSAAAQRVAELLSIMTTRQESLRNAGAGGRLDAPDVLVVLDGSRRLRSLPGVPQLLADGPALGIHLVCVDAEARLLPEECKAVGILDARGNLTVRQSGVDVVESVRPDLVTPAWCERVARSLAALRDVSRDDDSALPDAARLVEVLGLTNPTADQILAGWATGVTSTEAVVGVGLDGPFALDLRRDGPHGLIAGTTGSGKSELLQTLVAALAVANRPDAMNFVLVDYKGGSAFAECARLPHTVGMVTDLDVHLVGRALESLSAELRRREHWFADAGVADLEAYLAARHRNPALPALPRLLIAIDEFASLARELPDFVTGLVNIAQRGRSLGIHLILATQRPSGVVSAEIRANTNLRIALRVTDAGESTDVIDAPDAARIAKANPGRAYVRLGHSALVPFQAARVGGPAPGRRAVATAPPFVAVVDPAAFGAPAPARPRAANASDTAPVTDLAELVEAIREAVELLALPPQPSPWLPPLPTHLVVDDLEAPERSGDATLRPAPFALVDLPAAQAREVESIDLATFGHLFVAGSPRSGRSQALRTIAGSLARANSAADVHLFGLDCGNGALLPVGDLPHCGAVVRVVETERVERLLDKLSATVRERMAQLGQGHFGDIGEQRAAVRPQERLPHLVLLLDRWEGFVATLDRHGEEGVARVMRLAREGVGVGVHLVVSGDQSLLGGRLGVLTEHKIVLRLADKGDYGHVGVSARSVPDGLPDGRGYLAPGGATVQIALLDPDPSGRAQGEALARIAAAARERDYPLPEARRPFAVDVLPAAIPFDDAWRLRPTTAGPLWALIGVGGDRLTGYGPVLDEGTPAFLIGGPPRSGRSTALQSVALSCLAGGARLLVVLPRASPLADLAGEDGVVAVGEDLSPDTLRAAIEAGGPLVVLVDDADLATHLAAGQELSEIVHRHHPGVAVVAAGDPEGLGKGFSGWQVDAKRARRGLLLSPQNQTDAELLGTQVPRPLIGNPIEPGRGLLHLGDGQLITVQVPLPVA
ncbi:MAG: FtsK/SpoIIIE domain-containing protein [Sporichthyaceae bacterium]